MGIMQQDKYTKHVREHNKTYLFKTRMDVGQIGKLVANGSKRDTQEHNMPFHLFSSLHTLLSSHVLLQGPQKNICVLIRTSSHFVGTSPSRIFLCCMCLASSSNRTLFDHHCNSSGYWNIYSFDMMEKIGSKFLESVGLNEGRGMSCFKQKTQFECSAPKRYFAIIPMVLQQLIRDKDSQKLLKPSYLISFVVVEPSLFVEETAQGPHHPYQGRHNLQQGYQGRHLQYGLQDIS